MPTLTSKTEKYGKAAILNQTRNNMDNNYEGFLTTNACANKIYPVNMCMIQKKDKCSKQTGHIRRIVNGKGQGVQENKNALEHYVAVAYHGSYYDACFCIRR